MSSVNESERVGMLKGAFAAFAIVFFVGLLTVGVVTAKDFMDKREVERDCLSNVAFSYCQGNGLRYSGLDGEFDVDGFVCQSFPYGEGNSRVMSFTSVESARCKP